MPDQKKIPVPTAELGRSGLNQQSGYITEELVPELAGQHWQRAVREMTDQDAVIGALLFAIEMLIRQVEFKFEPADIKTKAKPKPEVPDTEELPTEPKTYATVDTSPRPSPKDSAPKTLPAAKPDPTATPSQDPNIVDDTAESDTDPEIEKAQEIADFFNEAMHDMEISWSDTLSEILSFLPWGWSYFEKVYKYRKGDAPGTPVVEFSRYDDGKVAWRKWGIRAQETLYKWEYNDETGELLGMVQNAPPLYKTVLIPAWKAIHFKSSSKKESPEGKSILRSAWRSWYLKKRIENMEAISIEKSVVGMPVFWVPINILMGTEPEEIIAKQNYMRIAANLKTDEQMGLVMPLDYDEKGNKQYDVTLLAPTHSSGQSIDTGAVVARHNRDMAMSVIADFMVMGHGSSTGSFALASSKTELFAKAVGAWMDNICETANKQAVPDLMNLNGWDRTYSPKMVHGDIETIDLTELGAYIQKLALAGVPIFEQLKIINFLLEQAGMPTMTEEELEEALSSASPPMGLLGMPQDPNDPNAPPIPPGQKPDTGGLLPGQNGYQGPNAPIITQKVSPSTRQKKKPVIQKKPQSTKLRTRPAASGD